MTATIEKQRSGGILGFVRGVRSATVSEFHEGDIYADSKVIVTKDAAVVGDVVAPKVEIAGIVCGFIVAKEAHIRATAQIWGDVYVQSLRLDDSARVHGWLSTIDDIGYEEMQQDISTLPEVPDLPLSLVDHQSAIPPKRIAALRRLQKEAAVALAALSELEQDFERKLQGTAGESVTELRELRQKMMSAQTEQAHLQQQLDDAQARLLAQETERSALEIELSQLRTEVTHRREGMSVLEERLASQAVEVGALSEAKVNVEHRLQETLLNLDDLSNRTQNLEGALTAGVELTTEQNEALLRWQELAEQRGVKVSELTRKLSQLQEELENQQVNAGNLQHDRDNLNQTIEMLKDERNSLQFRVEELEIQSAHLGQVEAELEQWQANAEKVAQQLTKLQTENDELSITLSDAQANISPLLAEQEQTQELIVQRDTEIERWQGLLAEQTAQTNNLEATITELQAQKRALIAQTETLQTELTTQTNVVKLAKQNYQTALAEQLETAQATYSAELATLQAELKAHKEKIVATELSAQEEIAGKLAGVQSEHTTNLSALQAKFAEQIKEIEVEKAAQEKAFAGKLTAAEAEHEAEIVRWRQMVAEAEQAFTEQDRKSEARLLETRQQAAQVVTELQANLQEVEQSAAQLDAEVKRLMEEAQTHEFMSVQLQEQVNWAKALLNEQQVELSNWRQTAHKYQVQGQKWRANAGSLTELLYQAEQKLIKANQASEEKSAQLATEQEKHTEEHKRALKELAWQNKSATEALEAEIRQLRSRQQVDTVEIEMLHQSFTDQGARLAELQATIVERDIALRRALQEIEVQRNAVQQVRQTADSRIHQLEQGLAESSRKLTDLTNYLERRTKREAKKEAEALEAQIAEVEEEAEEAEMPAETSETNEAESNSTVHEESV